jgi:hypothetical protein
MGLNEMLDPVPCHCGRCNRRNEHEKTGTRGQGRNRSVTGEFICYAHPINARKGK